VVSPTSTPTQASDGGQDLGSDLGAADRDEPLARGGALDDGGLGGALHAPVLDHLDMAEFGEDQLAVAREGETALLAVLRKGEAMIAKPGFVAWEANLLALLAPAREGLEGQVDALEHVLQGLGVDLCEFRAHRFARGEFRALVGEAKGDPSHAVGIAPLLQGAL
jgi:hypothetical protein